jgi:hypothetical protein
LTCVLVIIINSPGLHGRSVSSTLLVLEFSTRCVFALY